MTLLLAVSLFHHCRLTIFAFSDGRSLTYKKASFILSLPEMLWAGLRDAFSLGRARWLLRCMAAHIEHVPIGAAENQKDSYIAYLYPYFVDRSVAGGAMIAVVSDPLRAELRKRGIADERILLSPNRVDPDEFRPGFGGADIKDSTRNRTRRNCRRLCRYV